LSRKAISHSMSFVLGKPCSPTPIALPVSSPYQARAISFRPWSSPASRRQPSRSLRRSASRPFASAAHSSRRKLCSGRWPNWQLAARLNGGPSRWRSSPPSHSSRSGFGDGIPCVAPAATASLAGTYTDVARRYPLAEPQHPKSWLRPGDSWPGVQRSFQGLVLSPAFQPRDAAAPLAPQPPGQTRQRSGGAPRAITPENVNLTTSPCRYFPRRKVSSGCRPGRKDRALPLGQRCAACSSKTGGRLLAPALVPGQLADGISSRKCTRENTSSGRCHRKPGYLEGVIAARQNRTFRHPLYKSGCRLSEFSLVDGPALMPAPQIACHEEVKPKHAQGSQVLGSPRY
jgi:hypothetical protein